MTRVGAVLVTHNSERWIGQTMRSVREQSRIPDDIVIIDDHSTDRTLEIIASELGGAARVEDSASTDDSRITRIAENFDRGMRLLRDCDIVILGDHDDLWHPDRTQWQVAQLETYPHVSMLASDGRLVDGDGVIASNIYLGVGNTITNAAGASEITDITPTTLLAADKTSTQLWLQTFGSHAAVSSAWAEVRTPDMVLAPGGTSSSQLDLTLEKQLMIPKAGTVNQWELNTPYSGFTAPGKYEIYYYSRDAISSEISPMKRSIVYKQKTGNMPPEKVQNLVAPENGAKLKTMSAFEWTAATDPEKAALTYTLEIATDEAFTNIVHKEEEIAGTATYVADGILKDLTNYYWRIIAVDQYGEKSTSTVSSFSTDNTNGLPGLITGYVRSDGTGSAIPTATVKIGDGIASQVMPNGAYLLQSGTGATTVTIQSAGYKTKILNVTITAGKVLNSSVYLSPDTPASVNGICGANDKVNLISAPTTGFCTSGNATPVVTGSNSWSWTCEGTNGGSTANCAASKTKAGDCDGSGTVTIAEVQSAINMFLGLKTVEACVDLDSSNSVSIAEVQKVINSFLGL